METLNILCWIILLIIVFILVLTVLRLKSEREIIKLLANQYDNEMEQDNLITYDDIDGESVSNENLSDPTARKREHREDTNRLVLINTLRNMRCQPLLNDDKNIEVAYQGENFLIQFNGAFIRIWDLSWFSTKATDDNFTLLKDASNYANFSFGPTIIMHTPDENGNILLSSRFDILFVPDEKDNEGYVAALLDSFFSLKNNLQREIGRLKDNPQDRTMIDNPIGFDTATLSDPTSPQAN